MKAIKKLMVGAMFMGSFGLAQADGISPWLQYWDADFTGELSGDNGAGVAGSAKIRKVSDESFGAGFKVKFLGLNSTFSYSQLKFKSVLDVTGNFTFDDKTIAVGDDPNIDYEWNTFDLAFRWGRLGRGDNKLQFLGGVQVVDAAIKIHGGGLLAANNVDLSETLPIPYIGASGSFRLADNFNLEATVKALDLSLDDNDVKYVDLEAGVEWKMRANGSLFLGYKSKDLDVKINKGKADAAAFDTKKDGLLLAWRFKF